MGSPRASRGSAIHVFLVSNCQRAALQRGEACVKSGFQILYAVEQFSSLFSKDKLKQGAHIHQTHDPPSPRMPWENYSLVPSQQLPHVLCGAGTYIKGLTSADYSVTDRRLCHADEPQ